MESNSPEARGSLLPRHRSPEGTEQSSRFLRSENVTNSGEVNSGDVILPPSFQRAAPKDNWNDPPSLLAARVKPNLSGSARQLDVASGQQIFPSSSGAAQNASHFSSVGPLPAFAPSYQSASTNSSISHSASYPNLIPFENDAGFPPPRSNPTFISSAGASQIHGGASTALNKLKETIANSFRSHTATGKVSPAQQSESSMPLRQNYESFIADSPKQNFVATDAVDGSNTHSSTVSANESLNTLQAIWYYQTLQTAVDEIKPAWVPFTPPENRKLELAYRMWVECRGKQAVLSEFESNVVTDNITGEENAKHASAVAATSPANVQHLCSVFGGRHDVDFEQMQLVCVFWDEPPRLVLRATWFYKGATETAFLPYDQSVCLRFEEDYQRTWRLGTWHNRIDIGNGEALVIHSPNAISHFVQPEQSAVWVTVPDALLRPRAVKRSAEGVHIDYPAATAASQSAAPGSAAFPLPTAELPATWTTANAAAQYYDSSYDVDHLVFVVHGIGSVCDLKMRNVIECVGNLRQMARSLLLEHWRDYLEQNQIHRVEFLPIEWHSKLHGETTGVDERLKTITLPSIPKLRNFTNETLLDILFYTSPTYCQTIAETVALEINRLYELYKKRNPRFCGKVSIIGHSLGSLIVFDLLANQQRPAAPPQQSVARNETVGDAASDNNVAPAAVDLPEIFVPIDNADANDRMMETSLNSSTACTLEELITRSGVILPESGNAATAENSLTAEKYAEKLRTEAGVRTVEDIMLLTETDFDKLNIPLVERRRLIMAASSVLPGGRIAQLRRHHYLEQQHQLRRNAPHRRSLSVASGRGSSLVREPRQKNENSIESYQNDLTNSAWRRDTSELSLQSVGLYDGAGGGSVATSISEPNLSTILKQMSTLAVNYTVSTDANGGGVGQPSVYYPKLVVEPECFFAIGSPIGMFLTVRGVKTIGIDYKLPTCSRFMNLFHPYDVVAYRIEPLIRPDLIDSTTLPTPVQLPHHKGRKRYHRQLQEHMGTVTAGLKTKLVDNIWSTLTSWPFGGAAAGAKGVSSDSKSQPQPSMNEAVLNAAVNINSRFSSDISNVVADPGTAHGVTANNPVDHTLTPSSPSRNDHVLPAQMQNMPLPPQIAASVGTSLIPNDAAVNSSASSPVMDMGQLNEGNRVDYVLQESALESVNQYLFAFHAHTCYWDSEDTIFMILMELYGKDGFAPRQFPHAMAGGSAASHHHQHHQHHQAAHYSAALSDSMPPPPPPPPPSSGIQINPPPLVPSDVGVNLSTSPFGMPPLHGSHQYPLLPGAAYASGSISSVNRSPIPPHGGPYQPLGPSPPPPPYSAIGGAVPPIMPLAPPSLMPPTGAYQFQPPPTGFFRVPPVPRPPSSWQPR